MTDTTWTPSPSPTPTPMTPYEIWWGDEMWYLVGMLGILAVIGLFILAVFVLLLGGEGR